MMIVYIYIQLNLVNKMNTNTMEYFQMQLLNQRL